MLTLESALLAQRLLDQTEGCYPGMPHLSWKDDTGLEPLPPMQVSIDYQIHPETHEEIMVVRHYVNGVLQESLPS